MFRATLTRCLVFAARVDGTTTSSSQQRQPRRRSFLVKPSNKSDPHTRQPHTNRASAFATHGAANEGASTPSYVSQRQAFEASIRDVMRGTTSNVPGCLADNPLQSPAEGHQRRRQRDSSAPCRGTLPDDYYAPTQPSRSQSRAERMREILKRNAVSSVEISSGGEADIDLGGLPPDAYHGRVGWTTIPENSSMFQDVINKDALPSRRRANSWGILRRQQEAATKGDGAVAAATNTNDDETFLQSRAASEDQWRRHNGAYRTTFDDHMTLAPVRDAVAYSRSTYALRKLYLDGLWGYMNMITPHEELSIAEEALHLTQSTTSCYIAEEARYCVNLYDSVTPLGVPSRDPLTLPLHRCPMLMTVLQRFFDLELIPSLPNVVQISEFVGTFSGYPPHRKPTSIGPYLGLLNLVSPAVLQTRHVEHPWAPRMLLLPRSLFIVQPPCLDEYALGYAATHQPFHNFDYATRFAADYRIEILFATVDVQNTKLLHETVSMTEYATDRAKVGALDRSSQKVGGAPRRMLTSHEGGRCATTASVSQQHVTGSVDEAIERLTQGAADHMLLGNRGADHAVSSVEAKEVLGATVGRAKPLVAATSSAAKSRIDELKARHKLLQETHYGTGRGVGVFVKGGNVQQGQRPGPKKL
jgi:hypothetical protein